ncbi:MAG: adenylate/guanylate cyclase domain-containing protein [Kiloniellales bacterium]|nr:adenylate/guanylate cyclase domain-containing protein [Kiloniellales bacterium]
MDEPVSSPEPWDIIEAASESILVTTADLDYPGPTIVYANRAFERMTGWPRTEITGRTPRLLQGPKTDHSIFRDMRRALAGEGRWEGLTVNYRKDGSEFFMEWSITPLVGAHGRPHHYVAVQRDVTARIEAERKIAEARARAQEAERRKMNLARYVSPGMAEILAERDVPLGKVRRQEVAILLIDIVGFTRIAEAMPPERVMALLRSFYRRMADTIFANEGSIEHFAGDSLMAVFGVPELTGKDATNAVTTALAMTAELDLWNAKRVAAGRQAIKVGISGHHGVVVLGDVGTRKSMSFTVIGDTVNTTSRIQELCRSLNLPFLASSELVERVRQENPNKATPEFRDAGTHTLRGRQRPIRVFAPASD